MVTTATPSPTTEEVLIAMPIDVLREFDQVAERMGLSRDRLMVGAARRFLLAERRWRVTQASIAAQAERSGLRTEDDIEAYLDSLPDDGR